MILYNDLGTSPTSSVCFLPHIIFGKEENLLRLRKNTQNKVLLFSMACSAVQILDGEKLWNGLKTSH